MIKNRVVHINDNRYKKFSQQLTLWQEGKSDLDDVLSPFATDAKRDCIVKYQEDVVNGGSVYAVFIVPMEKDEEGRVVRNN